MARTRKTPIGKELVKEMFDSDDYRDWLRYRISTKTLDAKLEQFFWSLLVPKTVERQAPAEDLSKLTNTELLDLLETTKRQTAELIGSTPEQVEEDFPDIKGPETIQ